MRIYVIVATAFLLGIGILGFAFSQNFNIPTYLLLVNLILGAWGLWELFKPKKGNV